tara:strand:- start:61171 stop:62604 length:1434 start_codon:yes stop_codon:yes gene_type:complete
MLDTSFKMALKALLQNRLQALLTLSGMSIGVAMVVVVSGLGRGAQEQIENQIESAGPTMISIRSGNFQLLAQANGGQDSSGGEVSESGLVDAEMAMLGETDGTGAVSTKQRKVKITKVRSPAWPLRMEELDMLGNEIEDVRAVAGSLSGNLSVDRADESPVRIARLFGFQNSWHDMQSWKVLEGRAVSEREQNSGAPVMLISETTAARIWPAEDAIGKSLSLGGQNVSVVGIIADEEDQTSSIIVPTIYIPLQLAMDLLNRDTFDEITVRTRSVATTSRVAASIRESMRALRELPEDTLEDFRVETQSVSAMPGLGSDPRLSRAVHSNVVEFEQASWEEMAKSLRQAGRTFTLLLTAAAAVSLLVGGIGVMNIMLVSVAQRRREIGLRMALGARMNDVLVQFIVEAVTLAALGGLVGLGLGAIGLYIVDHGMNWATSVSPTMLFVAVAMAASTGIIFGYGPARSAASLDPVVALKID